MVLPRSREIWVGYVVRVMDAAKLGQRDNETAGFVWGAGDVTSRIWGLFVLPHPIDAPASAALCAPSPRGSAFSPPCLPTTTPRPSRDTTAAAAAAAYSPTHPQGSTPSDWPAVSETCLHVSSQLLLLVLSASAHHLRPFALSDDQ
jgi:hypothetical protein